MDYLAKSNFDNKKFKNNYKGVVKRLVKEGERMHKININWYPGHMAKARKEILNEIKNIDIVYEIIDARIPYSSKIKDIDDIIKNKLRILIMTKKDLCDLKVTNKWVKYYENLGYKVVLVDLKNSNDYKKIMDITDECTKSIQEKRKEKGLLQKEILALVIGIPNTGKSTLINKIAGKNVCDVQNKAGVTKNLSYIKTKWGIKLLDTPGILWPKLDDEEVAYNIALTGGINKEVLNMDDICIHVLEFLKEYYPDKLYELYHIKDENIEEMYEIIGKSIGAIKNDEIDYERVSLKVYNDVTCGKIKGVTFDIWKS